MRRSDEPGDVLDGRYRLERSLGRGGFGTVWAATRLADGEHVAIKVLKDGLARDAVARFAREADALARLQHPNCVRLIEYVARGPAGLIVMERVDGRTLHEWAASPRSHDEVLSVAEQIARALDAAHAQGIVHRDIKPSNVMISDAGEVRVLDFGIAKLFMDEQGDITATGEVLGTPGFMSPEQLRGGRHIGPATDLYCLGAILFELLEGRPPFLGDTPLAIGMAHLRDPVPQMSAGVPPHLQALVADLLAKSPSDRPPSAAAVLRRLAGPSPSPRLRYAWIAGLVIAIAGGLSIMFSGPVPRAARPLERERPSRPRSQDVAPSGEPDAHLPSGPIAVRPAGCGKPHEPGQRLLEVRDGLELVEAWAHIPERYDPGRLHATLVVLHARQQWAKDLLTELDLGGLADEHNLLVLAPQGERPRDDELGRRSRHPQSTWEPDKATAVWQVVEAMGDELCIDYDRLFVHGHIGGGRGADIWACLYAESLRGVSTSSYRMSTPDRCGDPVRAVPYLFFGPTGPGSAPVDGVPPTYDRPPMLGLQEHVDVLRARYGCEPSGRREPHPDGSCTQYDCGAGLEVCVMEASDRWPGWRDGTRRAHPTRFPFHDVLEAFLVRNGVNGGSGN